MTRLAIVSVGLLVAGLFTVAIVRAQESDTRPNAPATLADRLERLRQNLMPSQNAAAQSAHRQSKQRSANQTDRTPNSRSLARSAIEQRANTTARQSLSAARESVPNSAAAANAAGVAPRPDTGKFRPAQRARPRNNFAAGTNRTLQQTARNGVDSNAPAPPRPPLQQRLAGMQQSTPATTSSAARVKPAPRTAGVPTLAIRHDIESPDVTRPADAVARSGNASTTAVREESAITSRLNTNVVVEAVSPPSPNPRSASVPKHTPGTVKSVTKDPSLGINLGESSSAGHVLITQRAPQITTSVKGPRKVAVGRPADFHVAVRNGGTVKAKDLVISIRLPRWAEVEGNSPSKGTVQVSEAQVDETVLSWRLTSLEAQANERLELKIKANESKPVQLAVDWTHAPTSSGAVVDVVEPKLMMVVAGPDQVMFGETKVYKLTVSNPGTGAAENVAIRLMSLRPDADPAASHRLGTLRPGEARQLEVELTAREAGTLQVQAQAVADGGLVAKADKPVVVLRSDLQIEVGGPDVQYAGTEAVYRVRVSNPGTATARNVKIRAALPGGAKFVHGSGEAQANADRGKISWQLDALPSGAERVLELRCMLKQPGENRLIVSGQAADSLTDSNTATTNVIALADLKLDVSDPSSPVAVGQRAVYEIRVSNRGTKAADQVEVETFFSEGIEPVEAEGATHRIGPDGQIVFDTIDVVPAGGEVVLKVYGKANQPGNHIFRTQLRCRTLDTTLAAEETTRFYGDHKSDGANDRPSRLANKPSRDSSDESTSTEELRR